MQETEINQENLKVLIRNGIMIILVNIADIQNNSSPTFLSDSIMGGPRHLKKLAVKALNLASHLGKPHFMITVTCNPEWPEILELLGPGQTAFDRPDITCRVFHSKIAALIHNLVHGKYFGGRVKYLLPVIE